MSVKLYIVKAVLSGHSKRPNIAKCRSKVLQNGPILQYFPPSSNYHLPSGFLVLSILEWLLKTGFTVNYFISSNIHVGHWLKTTENNIYEHTAYKPHLTIKYMVDVL